MGTYQNVIQERGEQFGLVGSRTGSGHSPARHFHAALPVAQVSSETMTYHVDTVYTVGVDGIDVVIAAGATADLAALMDALIAAINAHPQISQIVDATLFSAGVMHLRARTPGDAFTLTETAAGTGTATPATVTANVAGTALNAGAPVFRAAAATNPRLVGLPTLATDVFEGLVQYRHRAGDLNNTPAGSSYAAGEQLPVDPDGAHIAAPSTDVEPGDDVYATLTTGALSNGSAATAQVETVTADAANDTTLYSLRITDDITGQSHIIEYTSDASATVAEIRDGLGDRINALPIPFTSADNGADAIDITADVATNPFTVSEVSADLSVANDTVCDVIKIPNGRWLTSTTAGNKGELTYKVS